MTKSFGFLIMQTLVEQVNINKLALNTPLGLFLFRKC